MNQMANQMSDQAIATDLLLSAKAGVQNCALALTEATSDDVRKTLNQQLQQAIIFHQRVADYMITQGYYHPYNLNEQIQVDQMTAQSVVNYSQQQGMGQQSMPQQSFQQQSYQQTQNMQQSNYQQAQSTQQQGNQQVQELANQLTQQQTDKQSLYNELFQQASSATNQQSTQQSAQTPDVEVNISVEDTDPAYEQTTNLGEQYYEMAHEYEGKQFLLPEGHEEQPSEE